MKLYGVIGNPIGHSLSPLLHNWALAQAGLQDKCFYMAWEVGSNQLTAFLNHLNLFQVKGLSVTIPHKQAILNFADKIDPLAQQIGAANTLVWQQDTWQAYNTDLFGFCAPLKQLELVLKSALILGAGGASLAVIHGLKDLGIKKIYLTNRTWDKTKTLAKKFDLIAVPWEERHTIQAELLVNTTPLGMQGKLVNLTPWEGSFTGVKVAYDLIYNPLQTLFLKQAVRAGCKTFSGLTMFVYQAQKQFELFTGIKFNFCQAFNLLQTHLQQASA